MKFSLEQLTVWEASPPEVVTIAAEAGYDAVSLYVQSPGYGIEVELDRDTPVRRETARRLRESGIRLQNLEAYVFLPDTRIEDFTASIASGAELGAASATALIFDPEEARVVERYGAFCDLAARHGLLANVEFIAHSKLPSLGAAERLVRAVSRDNAGLNIDLLPLIRSGGDPAQVAAIDPALIRYAQISDGPLKSSPERALTEGFDQREIPGEGEFQVGAFLAALPAGLTVGLEIPHKRLRDGGTAAAERAQIMLRAARSLVQLVKAG